jgi:ABC-type lipoprotein export system ATPase subunit
MIGLAVDSLVVRFASRTGPDRTLLSIPRWSVRPSERICIAGSSGSGKTTFLHVLAGLHLPDEGRVEVDGVALNELSEARRDRFRSRHVGMVFQTARLLSGLTALENVALAASLGGAKRGAARERAHALLERVGVSDRAAALSPELSVGERQRVAIARALATSPGLLLADEPTASLDPERTESTISMLHDIAEEHGTTMVLVSHERDVQARFDRVIHLEELQEGQSE